LRIKEQETRLTLQEHDDDDDDMSFYCAVNSKKLKQSRYRPGVDQRVPGS
jgi:hypothetical protein